MICVGEISEAQGFEGYGLSENVNAETGKCKVPLELRARVIKTCLR